MKEAFFEFYRLDKKKLKEIWENGLIVLDANALLDLYRYSAKTRNALLRILRKNKDRIWIPHQFALEYHINRLDVVHDQEKAYKEVEGILEKSSAELSKYAKHPFLKIVENKNKIESIVKKIKEIEEKHPDWFQEDKICDSITKLFKGKVGKPYNEKEAKEKYEEGAKRYENEIPPGYKDEKKGLKKYGDLIGWFQIIDKAKEVKKHIILITGERKEDWWRKVAGKMIGPRCELIREIHDKAGVSLNIYSIKNFLEHAKPEYRKIIDNEVIEEVKKIEKEIIKEIEEYPKVYPPVEVSSVVSERGPTAKPTVTGNNIDKFVEKLLEESLKKNIKPEKTKNKKKK